MGAPFLKDLALEEELPTRQAVRRGARDHLHRMRAYPEAMKPFAPSMADSSPLFLGRVTERSVLPQKKPDVNNSPPERKGPSNNAVAPCDANVPFKAIGRWPVKLQFQADRHTA